MFGQDAAAACSKPGNGNGKITASVGLPASTIEGMRTVPFPMVNPFKPALETGTAFPNAMIARPGRRYYGLGAGMGLEAPIFPATHESGHVEGVIREQGVSLPGSGGSLAERILASIRGILPGIPAIISAARAQPYYNPAQLGQGQQTVYGVPVQGSDYRTGAAGTSIGAQTGAALGNLGDTFGAIVAEHPYLVMAAGAAVVLWLTKPPGRR